MGTEEGLRELMNEVESLAKRVESGEIPETAMPRFFYCGHKHVCSYTGTEWFKCSCGHTWSVSESQYIDDWRKDNKVQYSCPACKKSELPQNIHWYHEYNQESRWECLGCKHQWNAKNGEVCPSCNLNHKDFRQCQPPTL